MEKKAVKTVFQGAEFSLETGWAARQADGSVWVKYGDTVVLATAVGKKEPKEDQDFFPLTVDYSEKMYASGRIPGNFFKREGKPSTEATLISRLIDRPIRPLFPEGFMNDVHVTINVLSYDGVHLPETLATVAASAALSISPIPFSGPIASVIVGLIDDKFVINPPTEKLADSKLHLSIAGTKDAIMMVEAGAALITEEQMLEALKIGHEALKSLIVLQEDFIKMVAKPKWEVTLKEVPKEMVDELKTKFAKDIKKAMNVTGKLEKYAALEEVKNQLNKYGIEKYGEDKAKEVAKVFSQLESEEVRDAIVNHHQRADGRKIEEIRPITCEVGVLPRVHGSALFTRGETQSLGTVTLGAGKDEVIVDGLETVFKKKFYLHYNFPAFSVNEVGGRPGPGRREIGHGALAERALSYVIPDEEKFPYVIRVVSDILESNGSSSMASVCSASMALMQAGVPIQEPISGVAMGLIKEKDKFVILTDIAGLEDHLGDMDFKVAGGKDGISALQMDIKITGVTFEIIKEALARANKARLEILGKMNKVIAKVNPELSEYAPRIETIMIPEDKVGELIGPSGKNIKGIIERTGVTIDIADGGKVNIASADLKAIEAAKLEINNMLKEPEPGAKYHGTVKKIMNFGLFIEYAPGKEGLLHISKASDTYINRLEDVFKVGDKIDVVIEEIDAKGRVNFSRA
ncbi:MAG: polyribonucleotide nucleotidyltransferase [Candidatus Margulisbacteria bacterium]|nr:polyribonucleotide nucleotidyltransferase [Candidatus Margulisiibacteriota bacterium]